MQEQTFLVGLSHHHTFAAKATRIALRQVHFRLQWQGDRCGIFNVLVAPIVALTRKWVRIDSSIALEAWRKDHDQAFDYSCIRFLLGALAFATPSSALSMKECSAKYKSAQADGSAKGHEVE